MWRNGGSEGGVGVGVSDTTAGDETRQTTQQTTDQTAGTAMSPDAAARTGARPVPAPVEIDVWSDVACPWCYIGKHRLEAGVREAGADVVVRFHSYELQPDAAPAPGTRELDALADRMGGRERTQQMFEHVTGIAAGEGLEYRFDDVIAANTFDAHRLIQLAKGHGLEEQAVERVFAAHFTEGIDVGDREALVALAGEIGLDADEARRVLDDGDLADAVRADERAAAQLGVTGVPFFVIDGRYGVSGAQPAALFAQGIRQALSDRGGAAAD